MSSAFIVFWDISVVILLLIAESVVKAIPMEGLEDEKVVQVQKDEEKVADEASEEPKAADSEQTKDAEEEVSLQEEASVQTEDAVEEPETEAEKAWNIGEKSWTLTFKQSDWFVL